MTKKEKLYKLKGKWKITTLEKKMFQGKLKNPSDATRRTLVAYFINGMEQREIVEEFGYTRQSVSNVLNRFIARLA